MSVIALKIIPLSFCQYSRPKLRGRSLTKKATIDVNQLNDVSASKDTVVKIGVGLASCML